MICNIRKAELKDAVGIANVHVKTWQSHYQGQVSDSYLNLLSVENRVKNWIETLSNLVPRDATFVYEDSGVVSGFCRVGQSKDVGSSPLTGELYVIYVSLSCQGRGIGSALLKSGLDFLRQEGFNKATLWVLKTNISTINFYKSRGWVFDGGEKKEEQNGFIFDESRYSIEL